MPECDKGINNVAIYIFKKNKYTDSYHVLLLEDKDGKYMSPAGELSDENDCFDSMKKIYKEKFGSEIPKIKNMKNYDMLKTRIFYGEIDKIGKFTKSSKVKGYQMANIDKLIENEFEDDEFPLRNHVKRSIEHLYEEGIFDDFIKYPLQQSTIKKNKIKKKEEYDEIVKATKKYIPKQPQYIVDPYNMIDTNNLVNAITSNPNQKIQFGIEQLKQYAVYIVPVINDQIVMDHEKRTGIHITLADFSVANTNFDHFLQQLSYYSSSQRWNISSRAITIMSSGIELYSDTLARIASIMEISGMRQVRKMRWKLKIDETDPQRFNYLLNRLLQANWQFALVEYVGNGHVIQYRRGFVYRLI